MPYNEADRAKALINAKLCDSKLPIKVKYTSPNHQRYYYGIFAPPAVGSEILVAYEKENLDSYYYLSTIVDHSVDLGLMSKKALGTSKGASLPADLFSEYKNYDDKGNPTAMFFKNEKDAGLKITNYYASGEPIINEVKLESGKGKRLILSDSPASECVVLSNEDGDSITIGSDVSVPYRLKKGGVIPRGISINSLNSQQCVVSNGEYVVNVTEGRDISLVNDSVGVYRAVAALSILGGTVPAGWLGPMDPLNLFGNVNLISKYRDINIFTDPTLPNLLGTRPSSIYLSTQFGFVQLVGGQGIKIFNQNPAFKVSVHSAGSVDVISKTGSINLLAPLGQVNIEAESINMKATTVFNAAGNVATNIGSSSPLNLNSGVPVVISPLAKLGLADIPTPNVFGK